MKLYYAQPKHGPKAILKFEGQPLITNSPTLFLYLIRLNNEKAKFPSRFKEEDIEVEELSQKEVIDMFAEESFKYYRKELEKAYQKLMNIPVHYIVVEKLKDVPFGEYYLKQRKRRK